MHHKQPRQLHTNTLLLTVRIRVQSDFVASFLSIHHFFAKAIHFFKIHFLWCLYFSTLTTVLFCCSLQNFIPFFSYTKNITSFTPSAIQSFYPFTCVNLRFEMIDEWHLLRLLHKKLYVLSNFQHLSFLFIERNKLLYYNCCLFSIFLESLYALN